MRRLTQEAHIVKSEFERWEKIWKAGIIIAENTVTHEQTTIYGRDAYEKLGTPDCPGGLQVERFLCDPNTDELEELRKQIEIVKGKNYAPFSAAPSQDRPINPLATHRLSSLP
jgi:hypothetical protein